MLFQMLFTFALSVFLSNLARGLSILLIFSKSRFGFANSPAVCCITFLLALLFFFVSSLYFFVFLLFFLYHLGLNAWVIYFQTFLFSTLRTQFQFYIYFCCYLIDDFLSFKTTCSFPLETILTFCCRVISNI